MAAAGSLLVVAAGMTAYWPRPAGALTPAAEAPHDGHRPEDRPGNGQVAFSRRSYEQEGQELR
jgi:hypothetical protein